jgi:hypothetical protein
MEPEIAGIKSLRIFISYTIATKEFVGQLKYQLELYGFDVFCAHEDIRPAVEWQDDILRNLEMTDVFIPVLTNDYKVSNWTDQETGIAVAGQKFIVPLQIDITPYGFISKLQSLKLKAGGHDGIDIAVVDIIDAIIMRSKFKADMKSFFINALAESKSFEEAKLRSRTICNKFDNFSQGDVKRMYVAAIENHQVYESFGAQDALGTFFNHYKDLLSSEEYLAVIKRLKAAAG